MYKWWNPIHFIKGKKTIENEELIKRFAYPEEHGKRFLMTIFMYILPFIYVYLFLILTNLGNSEQNPNGQILNRTFLYIPMILIYFYIKYLRIKYERYLIDKCKSRENNFNLITELKN
jgi:hypothetical protein